MKKLISLLLVAVLCLAVSLAYAEKVGVSMPTKDLQRWNQDGANMQAQLEAAGYEVDLQYASNDVQTQLSQVENMINSGADVLVIAAIEGSSLGSALTQAIMSIRTALTCRSAVAAFRTARRPSTVLR